MPAASWPSIGRRRDRVIAIDEVQVAVADAAGDGADEHFVGQGLIDFDLFDCQRLCGPWKMAAFTVAPWIPPVAGGNGAHDTRIQPGVMASSLWGFIPEGSRGSTSLRRSPGGAT